MIYPDTCGCCSEAASGCKNRDITRDQSYPEITAVFYFTDFPYRSNMFLSSIYSVYKKPRRNNVHRSPVILQMCRDNHQSYKHNKRLWKKLDMRRRRNSGGSPKKKGPKPKTKYCRTCKITFKRRSSYTLHLKTRRHKKQIMISKITKEQQLYPIENETESESDNQMELIEEEDNNYCQECDRYFKNGVGLAVHRTRLHSNDPKVEDSPTPKQDYGQKCDRYFKNDNDLGGHNSSVHRNRKSKNKHYCQESESDNQMELIEEEDTDDENEEQCYNYYCPRM